VKRDQPRALLDPARTALVMIDIQNDFCHSDGACGRAGKDLSMMQGTIQKATELLQVARETGVLVVHVQHTVLEDGKSDAPAWRYFIAPLAPDGKVTVEGTWGHAFVDEIQPRAGEHILPKHRSSAFYSTRLEVLLRASQVSTIALCGVLAEGCVESTARDAFHRDFYPLIVADATGSLNRETHSSYLRVVSPRHDVMTTDAVVAAWRRNTVQRQAAA